MLLAVCRRAAPRSRHRQDTVRAILVADCTRRYALPRHAAPRGAKFRKAYMPVGRPGGLAGSPQPAAGRGVTRCRGLQGEGEYTSQPLLSVVARGPGQDLAGGTDTALP